MGGDGEEFGEEGRGLRSGGPRWGEFGWARDDEAGSGGGDGVRGGSCAGGVRGTERRWADGGKMTAEFGGDAIVKHTARVLYCCKFALPGVEPSSEFFANVSELNELRIFMQVRVREYAERVSG